MHLSDYLQYSAIVNDWRVLHQAKGISFHSSYQNCSHAIKFDESYKSIGILKKFFLCPSNNFVTLPNHKDRLLFKSASSDLEQLFLLYL